MHEAPPPSVFDRFPIPPASRLLGWTLRDVDPAAGTIEIGFTADERAGFRRLDEGDVETDRRRIDLAVGHRE